MTKFYLQYDGNTNTRYLSETNTEGAGSIFSSIAGTSTDFTLPVKPGKILRADVGKIHLFFAVSGSVAVTPVMMLSVPRYVEGNPIPIWEEVMLSPNDIETRNTFLGDTGKTFDWDFPINSNYSLENSKIVLRIFLEDTRANPGNPSSITIDNESHFEGVISSGETQSVQAFTNAHFRLFQRTERIFGWTTTRAKEGISIPLWTNANNKEQIMLDAYTRTDVKESVIVNLGTNVETHGPFTDALPHVRDIEIGDYVLPTWETSTTKKFNLRKRDLLYDLTEEASTDYQILVPPPPTTVPFAETALSSAANKMVETFEMLKSFEDHTTPGEFFRVFFAGALGGGTVIYREGEWQLPLGFTSGDYSIPFTINPVNQLRPVNTGDSLWFCLRHRLVGASVSAYYKERAGKLLLRKKITSTEEVRVWMWETASAPFTVSLYASNQILQKPGFAGKSACLMVV